MIRKMKLISEGAEAKIYLDNNNIIIKERINKKYRHKLIDEKIIKQRIKSEEKIYKKSYSEGINVPKILKTEDNKIYMEYINGNKLSEIIEEKPDLVKKLANQIILLHKHGIVHGDLTTSNVLVKENSIYLIDFGLSKFTDRIEDKATDIHLFKECLNSRHSKNYRKLWKIFSKEYSDKEVLDRLKKIESRVRYNRVS